MDDLFDQEAEAPKTRNGTTCRTDLNRLPLDFQSGSLGQSLEG